MPYIGNTIRAADDYRLIDDISSSFNGSTTSFALQVAGSAPVPFPKSPQQVLISVNGVIQEPDPTGSSGFNLVGTNIVFSSAPTNGHAFFGIIYATADYLNAGGNFPSGSLGAPSLTFIGDENTGLYRKSGGSVGFVSDATEIANFDSNGITISSGNLILGDSSGANDDRIKLGASGDLEIYHDGSNTRIANSTGDLKLQGGGDDILLQPVDTEIALKAVPNGAVELYHDNAKKAETVTGGFTVTGVCTATSFAGDGSSLSGINTDLVSDTSPQLGGNLDVNTKNIVFGDSAGATDDRLTFGAGTDLSIYHDGDHSTILDNGTGNLKIYTNGAGVDIQKSNGENLAKFITDGAVELYHDNTKRLETTSTGAQVTGEFSQLAGTYTNASGGFVRVRHDSGKFTAGASDDLEMFHDGTASRLHSGSHPFYIRSGGQFGVFKGDGTESIITGTPDGAVDLYYDNSKKLETISTGVTVTGRINSSSFGSQGAYSGQFGRIRVGADTHGNVIRLITDTNLNLAANNTIAFYIGGATDGSSFGTGIAFFDSSGFKPASNNTFDLGGTSNRWANLYTNDLHLSNEGHSNDVDSTWGDYTIQEGFEDLFLINNRTGKKFKFNLTEVS